MLITSLLRSDDAARHDIEKALVLSCRALSELYAKDKSVLKTTEAPFILSIARNPNLLSYNQLTATHTILKKYASLLIDIQLPTTEEMLTFIECQKHTVDQKRSSILIDVTNDVISIKFPERRDEWTRKILDFKGYLIQAHYQGRLSLPDVDLKHWIFYNTKDNRWEFPRSDKVFDALTDKDYFSYEKGTVALSPAASLYIDRRQKDKAARLLHAQRIREKQLTETMDMINAIGGVESEFGPGFHFFAHQKEDIPLLAHWRFATLAWQQGLGKTISVLFTAKALAVAHGWRIFVIATKSGQGVWKDAAEKLHVTIELYTWRGMPLAKNSEGQYNDIGGSFILIADEAQYAQNLPPYTTLDTYAKTKMLFRKSGGSQQAAKFVELALHPDCCSCFPVTGTPMPNGRPINEEALLIATRHKLLYAETQAERRKKRASYELKYCGAQYNKQVGAKVFIPYWANGAAHLEDLHLQTVFKQGRENSATARMIRRLKTECMDLPEKRRFWQAAELSSEDEKRFEKELALSWERYERHLQEKLAAFIAEYIEEEGHAPSPSKVAEEEGRMRLAEALVELTYLRKCASIAKLNHTAQQAYDLATDIDDPRPAVIFTAWKTDVALPLARKLESMFSETPCDERTPIEHLEHVAVITGDTQDRAELIHRFQQGNYKAIVCTHKAAGEAITLNRASDMWLIDRPWTPGAADQSEDRIHRIGQKNHCNFYWVQIPDDLSKVDQHCDAIVIGKATNINQAIEGIGKVGIEFQGQTFSEQKDALNVLQAVWQQQQEKKK